MSAAVAVRESAPVTDQISARNFERLARYIYDYSGIKMPSSKRTMLEGRLRRRLRQTGHATFDDYCDHLFRDNGMETESVYLIDAVTTNKTDFFREPKHFEYLAQRVLPEMADQRRLRLWSAACSTGAEPYTLAMVVQDFIDKQAAAQDYFILGTDLSTDVLEVAHRGVYPTEMLAPVPADVRRRHVMEPKDPKRREARIHPALRARLGLARLNLMDETYAVGEPFDVIMCRNVMIYFDKPTQARVLKRLCDRLRPGGYLFIGHSESITGVELPVVTVANTVFRKT